MEKKEWFAEWFDTAYYHTLYCHRDESEAERFITRLMEFLNLPKGSEVLDLACGKGRHSQTLSKLGYKVLGADLSSNSIQIASTSSSETLSFIVHDMREVIEGRHFDAVLNLFTSFGYFEDVKDNEKVIDAVYRMLNPGGLFVIDFLNAVRTRERLVPEETQSIGGIDFRIERRYTGTHFIKDIRFSDNGQQYHFTEKVQALDSAQFRQMLEERGFEIIRTFGDFDLHPFDPEQSDRMIMISRKK